MAEEETDHGCKEETYTLLHKAIFFRKKTSLCQLFFLLETGLCRSTEEPLLFQVHAQHLSKSWILLVFYQPPCTHVFVTEAYKQVKLFSR